jgi:hypothetical protein
MTPWPANRATLNILVGRGVVIIGIHGGFPKQLSWKIFEFLLTDTLLDYYLILKTLAVKYVQIMKHYLFLQCSFTSNRNFGCLSTTFVLKALAVLVFPYSELRNITSM